MDDYKWTIDEVIHLIFKSLLIDNELGNGRIFYGVRLNAEFTI